MRCPFIPPHRKKGEAQDIIFIMVLWTSNLPEERCIEGSNIFQFTTPQRKSMKSWGPSATIFGHHIFFVHQMAPEFCSVVAFWQTTWHSSHHNVLGYFLHHFEKLIFLVSCLQPRRQFQVFTKAYLGYEWLYTWNIVKASFNDNLGKI